MAKMGRPRKEDGEAGTTLVRVNDEMARMLSDLVLVLPKTTAQIIQQAAGVEIEELHRKYAPQIANVRAAQKAADEALQNARAEAEKMDKQETNPRRRGRPGS
jgi:hypothetical protein